MSYVDRPFSGVHTMQVRERPLGHGWFLQLQMETLGRNLATAGGLEYAMRLGMVEEFMDRQPTRLLVR